MTDEADARVSTRGPRRGPRGIAWAIAAVLVVVGSVVLALSSGWRPEVDAPVPIADVSSQRLLALGSVVGFAADHDTHAWLGMPYARPPVGERRWRAPEPPEAWGDTWDALAFGSPCVQLVSPFGGVTTDDPEGLAGEEDCLYLNVWAPRLEADEAGDVAARLPVLVWIHGGGNRSGYAGAPLYDGARLAGSQGVVVVSFDYRLGPFGWFSHPALRDEASNPLEASGNFGTLDQIRALEWVRDHIGEFGGDPDNVTIFGESAGGTNVLALMLAPPARGLFHRAIAQSGSTASVSRAEAEHALDAEVPGHRHSSAETTVSLLERAGVVPDREAARRYAEALPTADLRSFLRGRTAREVVDVHRDPDRPDSLDVPRLVRDGALLPVGDWLGAFRAGRFARVPVLLGSNRDEMKLYLAGDPERVRRRLGVLYRIRDPDDYERRSRYHSDLWAVRAVSAPASAIVASGFRSVYAYRFDWDELPRFLGADLARLLGAAHGFELPFLFGNFELGSSLLAQALFPESTRSVRERLSEQMMGYWTEFAATGRPGRGRSGEQPEWRPWAGDAGEASGEGATLLVLDAPGDGGIRLARVALSRDHVLASLAAEPGLAPDEKCALFGDLYARAPDWDDEALRRVRRRGCTDFPAIAPLR